MLRWLIPATSFLIAIGCTDSGSKSSSPPPKVNVDAPGVKVEVQGKDQGDGKVKVKAPGVNVEVKSK